MALTNEEKFKTGQRLLAQLIVKGMFEIEHLETLLTNYDASTLRAKFSNSLQKQIDELTEIKDWVDSL